MGDLKPLNGTNPPNPPFCFVLRHPAPLLSHPILQHYFHIPFPCFFPPFTRTLELNFHTTRITANNNKTATCLVFLPYLGSRKLPKAKSYRAMSNQSRKTPFQPETKDFGNARVYFTILKRPFPIGIHYDQVPNFSQYAEAMPSNIKSPVKDVGDFKMELIKVDKSGTQFIWLPMVRPASSLSSIPPDRPIPFLPHLYFKSQNSCNLYAFTIWTPLIALAITYVHSHVPTLSHVPFLRAVPAKHRLLFFLRLLPKICQADTSYQGQAGRWVELIKGKPHLGNNWSTAAITVAEKAKDLFLATVNEVHTQMNYSKVPTPHGGFVPVFPCETLYCGRKAAQSNIDWWWCIIAIFQVVGRNRYFRRRFCVITVPCV